MEDLRVASRSDSRSMDTIRLIGRIASIVAVAVVTAACDPADSARRGEELIAQAKASMGGAAWDQIEVWHEIGNVVTPSGASYRYEHWGDFRSLATRNQGENSALVFDSLAVYLCTASGCTPKGDDVSKAFEEGAFTAAFGYFFPQRFPLTYWYTGTEEVNGIAFDVVRVSPAGRRPFDVWLDQSTHYVARVVLSDGVTTSEFSDYRKVGKVSVPFVTADQGVIVRADSIGFAPAGSVSFEPAALPSDSQSK